MKKHSDVYVAILVVGILALMILPLNPFFLDILLAANISAALCILLVTLYTTQPLDFSSFPSVLLLTTLFRLSLNIASTRLILLHGNEGTEAAGGVIRAFGSFVVGGNYVVGAVIFLILVIINFTVITKGAGRIAEVAARFTLDAMPGKQMAIDADLAAHLINEAQAKARRIKISREADFYGSMDGASKFVRGDAIAGILIMLVNIVGGFVIGIWQQGMPFEAALSNYTLLTIGEGLVAQIPALVISTAAGVIVTRSAEEQDFGSELSGQLAGYPKAFKIVSAILFVIALIPGFPHFAFLLLSGVAFLISKQAREVAAPEEEQLNSPQAQQPGGPVVNPVDQLELQIGMGLVKLVDAAHGEVLTGIRNIRKQFADRMGFVVPPVHIHDNADLKHFEYVILIKGARVGGGELPRQFVAMDTGMVSGPLAADRTVEPVFGLQAYWIGAEDKDKAAAMGYMVFDNATVINTHVSEIVKRHAHELLGRQELQELIDAVAQVAPKVVDELIPALVPSSTVLKVLRNLLREGVSIRDMRSILEAMADNAVPGCDPDLLTEYVRIALGRSIVEQCRGDEDMLPLLQLESSVVKLLSGVVRQDLPGAPPLDPSDTQRIINGLSRAIEQAGFLGRPAVLATSMPLRRYVKRLTERFMPNLYVLSYEEIPQHTKIKTMGVVTLDAD